MYCKSIDDLFNDKCCFGLWNSTFIFDFFLKLSAVAVLHDDDFQEVVWVDVETFNDIVAVADQHQFRLGSGQALLYLFYFLIRFFLYSVKVEDFDGNCLFGLIIHAFVDGSKGSFSKFIIDNVLVDAGVGDGLPSSKILLICEVQTMHLGALFGLHQC